MRLSNEYKIILYNIDVEFLNVLISQIDTLKSEDLNCDDK
jgi:hypothetical protein